MCAAAYDFTVQGGSIGRWASGRWRGCASWRCASAIPMVWLIDSARRAPLRRSEAAARISSPSRIPEHLFREQVVMSGVVPQVAAMVGPGAAGTAYIPGLADFVPMVRGTSAPSPSAGRIW